VRYTERERIESGPKRVAPLRETMEETAAIAEEQQPIVRSDDPVAPPADWRVTEALLEIARRWPGYAGLAWDMLRDRRVPASARRWLAAAGAYSLSPVDPVPGVIPILVQLDDYAVLLLGIRRALRACSPEVRAEHLKQRGFTETEIDRDLKQMRRIAGHVTRRTAWGVWAGLRFVAGVGVELGRQAMVGAARQLQPTPEAPGGQLQEERRNRPVRVEPDGNGQDVG
jgi:uncharacterized membrane protein YkvA (DUF1232 family)